MIGKVSLYVPGEEGAAVLSTVAYSKISAKVKLAGAFKYSDEKEAVRFASKTAASGETAIVAADESRFNSIKLMLLKVLSVKVLQSSEIIEKIGDSLPVDSNEYKINVAVPAGSRVTVSENGLFSPFKCRCGKGLIIMVPLEEKALTYAIDSGVLEGEDPQKSSKEKLNERLKAIADSGKSVGIASMGLSKALTNIFKNSDVPGIKHSTAEVDEEGDPSQKDYIANIASRAREKTGSDFGAAMSDISSDGTISVAVADADCAKVEVVHPVEGEDRSQLAKVATFKAVEMISRSVSGGINPPEKKPEKNSYKPLIIIIICLAVAAAICLTVGFVVYRKSIKGTAGNEAVSVTVNVQTITDAEPEETEEGDENGEVVPVLDEDESDAEQAFLDLIDTTYSGSGDKTAAANGMFTTNAGDLVSDLTTTTTATVTSLIHSITGRKTTAGDESSTEVSEESETTTQAAPQGYFLFTVYGYGHGVGMSQRGAIALANQGKTCSQILTHYYQNVTLMVDKNTPKTITRRGTEMTLVAFLCRTVKKEIGSSSPMEALKAQAVAAYTYAMCNNFDNQQAFDPYFDYKGTSVEAAVFDVLHITDEEQDPHAVYVSYNGTYANTVYCASVAGRTTSAKSVWGSGKYDGYLNGGKSSPETVEVTTVQIGTSEMKRIIENYTGNKLDGTDPSTWLSILSHDGSYSNSIGYVDKISVGGKVISGNAFRSSVLGNRIKSHCFTIKYFRYQ